MSDTQSNSADAWPEFMRPPMASRYLKQVWGIDRTPATLATNRSRGGGAKYHKAGSAVIYRRPNLDQHAAELLGEAVTSTSELRAKRQASAAVEAAPGAQ
jgi:hypothetical protein